MVTACHTKLANAVLLLGLVASTGAKCFFKNPCGVKSDGEFCCKSNHYCVDPATNLCKTSDCAKKFADHTASKLPCNVNATTGKPVDLVCGPLTPKEYGASINNVQHFYDRVCTAVAFKCTTSTTFTAFKTQGVFNPKCPVTTVPVTEPATSTVGATSASVSTVGASSATGAAVPHVALTSCYYSESTCSTVATDILSSTSCNLGASEAQTVCKDMCFTISLTAPMAGITAAEYCSSIHATTFATCTAMPAGDSSLFVKQTCAAATQTGTTLVAGTTSAGTTPAAGTTIVAGTTSAGTTPAAGTTIVAGTTSAGMSAAEQKAVVVALAKMGQGMAKKTYDTCTATKSAADCATEKTALDNANAAVAAAEASASAVLYSNAAVVLAAAMLGAMW